MPPHLCNGLTRPADYSMFAREWTRPPAGVFMLAQDSVLDYGHPAGERC